MHTRTHFAALLITNISHMTMRKYYRGRGIKKILRGAIKLQNIRAYSNGITDNENTITDY